MRHLAASQRYAEKIESSNRGLEMRLTVDTVLLGSISGGGRLLRRPRARRGFDHAPRAAGERDGEGIDFLKVRCRVRHAAFGVTR